MAGHRWESSVKGRCDAAVRYVHTPTGEMYPILNIYTSSRGSKVYGARDSIKMTVAPAACFVCAQPGPPARLDSTSCATTLHLLFALPKVQPAAALQFSKFIRRVCVSAT